MSQIETLKERIEREHKSVIEIQNNTYNALNQFVKVELFQFKERDNVLTGGIVHLTINEKPQKRSFKDWRLTVNISCWLEHELMNHWEKFDRKIINRYFINIWLKREFDKLES